jgi:subtilisin family serine protease
MPQESSYITDALNHFEKVGSSFDENGIRFVNSNNGLHLEKKTDENSVLIPANSIDDPVYRLPPIKVNELIQFMPYSQSVDWGMSILGIPELWKMTKGKGVKVAILDTGIDFNHKDLTGAFNTPYDLTNSRSGAFDIAGHGCIRKGTKVYTGDYGLQKVEDLWEIWKESKIKFKVLGFTGKEEKETNISDMMKLRHIGDSYRVKTPGGEIVLTPWHKVFVFTDKREIVEKRADELKVGEWLLHSKGDFWFGRDYKYIDNIKIDEELAWLFGFFLGDGSGINQKRADGSSAYHISFLSETPEIIEKCKKIMLENLKKEKYSLDSDTRSNVDRLVYYGKLLEEFFFKCLKVRNGKDSTMDLPDWIWESPKSVALSFLAGYLDSDGHVAEDRYRINYTTVSQKMANSVVSLLSIMGIPASLGIIYPRIGKREKKICYQIECRGESYFKLKSQFFSYVTHPKKKERLLKEDPSMVARDNFWFDIERRDSDRFYISQEAIDLVYSKVKTKREVPKRLQDRMRNRFRSSKEDWKMEFRDMGILFKEEYLVESLGGHTGNIAVKIKGIEKFIDDEDYYDFTVPETENYLAGEGNLIFAHNTHCCGIVGARDNEIGIVGAAPECEIIPIKVLGDDGSGSSRTVASGILKAIDLGADIISMSLGSPNPDNAIYQAVKLAILKNIWVIAAAGNEGPSLDTVGYPGKYPEVISIGAIDQSKNVTRFSSRGDSVDIVAPGNQILSTYTGNRYAKLSGTSMATPQVAGVCALLRALLKEKRQPIYSQKELETRLQQTATDLGETGKDYNSGFGLYNPANLLKSPSPEIPTIRIDSNDLSASGMNKVRSLLNPGNYTGEIKIGDKYTKLELLIPDLNQPIPVPTPTPQPKPIPKPDPLEPFNPFK